MQAIRTSPQPTRSSGLLKGEDPPPYCRRIPWGPLRRHRPVHPQALRKFLLGYERLGKALRRHQHFFPEQPVTDKFSHMKHVSTHTYHTPPGAEAHNSLGWWQVLGSLVNLVDEYEWLEINWEVLNEAWATWQGAEDSEAMHGSHLAVYLDYIPVKMYGFDCNGPIFEFPPIELFHALFSTKCTVQSVSADLLINIEVYDDFDDVWTPEDQAQAWELLDEIESDPGQYPEPVRWLPELVRWACHQTGNPLLDQTFQPYQNGPWYPWDDLDEVRYAW
ncbi:MAG: hypothetical protein GY934_03945, partial [Gammaproteobacteria bacterium]|nr:hypothetical protein [Gammaproteobacteria bacterium]